MDDGVQLGCTLHLEFTIYYSQNYCDLNNIVRWLKSTLSKEYVAKIINVTIQQKKENTQIIQIVRITFDSTANCFEAMMHITTRECGSLNAGITKIYCPCGRFVKVTQFPDPKNLLMKPIIEQFEKHGIVLTCKRMKFDDVYIGNFELIIFIRKDSKLSNKEWLDANKNKLRVEQYFANEGDKIPVEKINDLWKKYGYFADLPEVGKLVISDKKSVEEKIIEQVD